MRWLVGRSAWPAWSYSRCRHEASCPRPSVDPAALIVMVVAVLIGRLWQLQMVAGEKYRLLADRNRLREVDVAAPVWVIYDRNGEILAPNRPSFSVVVIPADLPQARRATRDAAAAAVVDRLLAPESPCPGTGPRSRSPRPAQPTLAQPQPHAPSAKRDSGPTPTPVLAIQERSPWIMPRKRWSQDRRGRPGRRRTGPSPSPATSRGYRLPAAEDAGQPAGRPARAGADPRLPTGACHLAHHRLHGPYPGGPARRLRGERVSAERAGGADPRWRRAIEESCAANPAARPSRWTSTAAVAHRRRASPAVPGHNLVLSLDLDLQRSPRRRCRRRWTAPRASRRPPRASSSRWIRATARSWRWSACPATTTTCSPRASRRRRGRADRERS